MTNYHLGTLDLTKRAEQVPVMRPTAGQGKRTGAQYAADLAAETETSLRADPERWRPATLGDKGGGRNIDNRRGRKLGPHTHGARL